MNGERFVSKGQNSLSRDLKVGEPFKVSLTLINNSGLLMPPSYLVLDPYQFSEELKRIVKDLRGKMIITSCFVTKVPEVMLLTYSYRVKTLLWLCLIPVVVDALCLRLISQSSFGRKVSQTPAVCNQRLQEDN